MIAFISGTIRLIRKDSVVVDTGGIGYEVFVSQPLKYALSSPVFFFTYQQFRDDGQFLYGFESETDFAVFEKLINVKGIGCRTALHMLSACPAAKMIEAIEASDTKALKALPGIGARTAGQIILDLKGKLVVQESAPASLASENPVWNEVLEALEALGYKNAQIARVRREVLADPSLKDVQSMLRKALGLLAKG